MSFYQQPIPQEGITPQAIERIFRGAMIPTTLREPFRNSGDRIVSMSRRTLPGHRDCQPEEYDHCVSCDDRRNTASKTRNAGGIRPADMQRHGTPDDGPYLSQRPELHRLRIPDHRGRWHLSASPCHVVPPIRGDRLGRAEHLLHINACADHRRDGPCVYRRH